MLLVSFVGSLFAPRVFVFAVLACFATDVRFTSPDLPVSFSLQELVIYGFVAAFLMRRFRLVLASLRTPVGKSVAFYTLLMIASTVPNLGEDPAHMLSVIRDTLVPMVWFVVFLNFVLFADRGTITKYFDFFILIGLISGLLGFAQHFLHRFVLFNEELNRDYFAILTEGSVAHAFPATGFFSYFNAYGIFEQMPLLISVVYFFYSSHKRRVKYLIASVILLVAQYFSFSRGTYASFVIAILVGLWVGGRRYKAVGYAVGATVAAITVLYVIPFFLSSPHQLATLLQRFSIWQTGYAYFVAKSNWLFGIGPGMFRQVVGSLWEVHNDYLMHLFENGLIGLLAFIVLVVVLISQSYKLFEETKPVPELAAPVFSCFLIFIGYFAQGVVEHSFASVIFPLIVFTFAALLVRANQDFELWKRENSSQ